MRRSLVQVCTVATAALCFAACSQDQAAESDATTRSSSAERPAPNPLRNAYFGDVHVHTKYSYDAFLFGTTSGPDDAYHYAKGNPIKHAAGFEMQLRKPLDFYAVSDHAALMGNLHVVSDPAFEISKHPVAKAFRNATTPEARGAAFSQALPYARGTKKGLLDIEATKTAWERIKESANHNNDPGRFTAFIAYEYTSSPESQNMHRNVIFRGSEGPERPFSRLDSYDPEDLWSWMENLRGQNIDTLAIPHNSNGSNGLMFGRVDYQGKQIDADYAGTRMRNEPLVEVTQAKGTSDTHPALSPNDEWANFEIYPYRIGERRPSQPSGSYVREAYRFGLEMEDAGGFNPYRFGLIGSSDTHNAATSDDETNFFGPSGLLESTPELRGSIPMSQPGTAGEKYSPSSKARIHEGASGVAGVWAEENTRESIFDAFRRKETFATTGPRMRIRFFAGYGLDENLDDDADMVSKAYNSATPMGGDLKSSSGEAPSFLVWAVRDPDSAALQRAQIIKAWIADGASHEKVFDVACSDGGAVDPATNRCPDNGATVDLSDCSFSADKGDAELHTVWTDPEFDATQRALYYVRVLENPTCRWSTWDAIRNNVEPRADKAKTIQERAWSSPIWYVP